MSIQTITGRITSLGLQVKESTFVIYDYIEVMDQAGAFVKLVNVCVAAECARALTTDNWVTLAVKTTEGVKSFQFPQNSGLSFLYVAVSEADQRVFEDLAVWEKDRQTVAGAKKFGDIMALGLVGVLVGTWLVGKAPFMLALVGMAVPGLLYIFKCAPLGKQLSMLATAEDATAVSDKLRREGLGALHQLHHELRDAKRRTPHSSNEQ